MMNRMDNLKGVLFLALTFTTLSVQAEKLMIKCPDQDYSVTGQEGGYTFIKGNTIATWGEVEHPIPNHGRFVDPGQPRNLSLTTLNIDIETYRAGKGVSFYCNLADSSNLKVAFATGSFLLKDIGIVGMVTGCANQANGSVSCEVI